ncbi:phage portal protein [Paracoccus beibuensis]|uniref:phage portal protein n=1 Tax=Paracoccus beibuensis TaxID=547602 RepID=UPI00223EC4C4|nr:phage portal protein [Paracoccus beibuensis]
MSDVNVVKPRVRVKASSQWTRVIAQGSAVGGFRAQAYEAAKSGKRSAAMGSTAIGPATAAIQSLDTLRNRSRHEFRNNPSIVPAIDAIVSHTVAGLTPNAKDPALLKAWRRFERECDAHCNTDFAGLLEQAMFEIVSAGETFARHRPRDPDRDPHLLVPYQVEMIPGEQVPTYDASGESIAGIVFSGPGRKAGVKFFKHRPDERIDLRSVGMNDFSIVPMDSVIHAFLPRYVGQVRGEPWLVRGLIGLSDLDAFLDAELVRHKLTAMHVFSVETPMRDELQDAPDDYDAEGNPINEDGTAWEPADPIELLPEFKPGAVVPLPPGYKLNPSTPAAISGGFDPFVKVQLRRVCKSLGVPYEIASGDSTGLNDRVLRFNLMEFRRTVRRWRRMLIAKVARPIWMRFLNEAVEVGVWTPPAGTTLEDYYNVEWIGEPMGHLHPKQEIEADILAMDAMIVSPQKVIRERGGDPDQVLADIAAWRAKLAEHGLTQADVNAALAAMSTSEQDDQKQKQEEADDE